jgi:hypothetical protein
MKIQVAGENDRSRQERVGRVTVQLWTAVIPRDQSTNVGVYTECGTVALIAVLVEMSPMFNSAIYSIATGCLRCSGVACFAFDLKHILISSI